MLCSPIVSHVDVEHLTAFDWQSACTSPVGVAIQMSSAALAHIALPCVTSESQAFQVV